MIQPFLLKPLCQPRDIVGPGNKHELGVKTAMNADYSWGKSAKEYQRIFEQVTRSGRDVLE